MYDPLATLTDVIETRFDEATARLHDQATYPELTFDFIELRCAYVGRNLAGLSSSEQIQLEQTKGYSLVSRIMALERIETKLSVFFKSGLANGLMGCPHRWRNWLARRYRHGDEIISTMIEDLPWTRLKLITEASAYLNHLRDLQRLYSDKDIPVLIDELRASIDRLSGVYTIVG